MEWLIGMEGRWGYNKLWSMAQVIRLKRAFMPAEIHCMHRGTSRRGKEQRDMEIWNIHVLW